MLANNNNDQIYNGPYTVTWTGPSLSNTYTDVITNGNYTIGIPAYKTDALIKREPTIEEHKKVVEQTCLTFTELLLSITPFKAKEFVEKNCNRVKKAIMRKLEELEDDK